MNDVETLRKLAAELAIEAGGAILQSTVSGASSKSSPTDLVTDADRAAEELIFRRLREERPDDSIVSEEGSVHSGTSGIEWVVDPLDGTINFVYGIPQWGVSIGIEGEVRAGVVYDPVRKELFSDDDKLSPSQQTDLAQALVGTGFSYSSEIRSRQAAVLGRVLPRVRDIRRAGSCALDLAWVANGRLDAFYEADTHRWDISAGTALIEAAGGFVEVIDNLTIAAGNFDLFQQLRALIRI